MSSKATFSKYFSNLQIRGIRKAGDILVPEETGFRKFSSTPFIQEIDRMADYMTDEDRSGFAFLMGLFAVLPKPVVSGVLRLAAASEGGSGALTAPLRLINLGVKGVVYTLYYSDLTPDRRIHKMLEWQTKCGEDPNAKIDVMTTAARAFHTARTGQTSLSQLSVSDRVKYISKLRELVIAGQEEIIEAIQLETGKSRSDALMSEIFSVLDHLSYLEKFSEKVLSDRKVYTSLVLMGKTSKVFFEPMGTSLVISPWNYPFYQAIVPITLSFVCGNTTVYKPSELTPLKGLVEKFLDAAGIGSEWVQVVYGDGKLGSELIDQRPDKIFFTGSTRTGKRIMEQASKYLIPVELELGGKDPMIVFEDADLHRTTSGALWGAMTNSGQSCTSVERLYVHQSIFDRFRDELVAKAKAMTVGNDTNGSTDIGTMTSEEQVKIVARHLEDALSKGAKQLTGKTWDKTSKKIPPIVLEGVTETMLVYREETFGPLLPIISFTSEEEVVRMANDSEYGLSASVWSKDKTRAERVARKIKTGNVSINNVMLSEGNHALPFGGVKNSGFGRFKGEFGFYSFSNVKSVIVDSMSSKIEANWYPYTPKKHQLFRQMMAGAFSKGLGSLVRFIVNGLSLESYSGKSAKRDVTQR